MGLSLKDRTKAFIRTIKVIFNPKTSYLNLLWVEGDLDNATTDIKNKDKILTHTFFETGKKSYEPFLVYMAQVAGQSNNLEELNQRAEFYLSKVAVAYKLLHKDRIEGYDIRFVGEPIRLFLKDSTPEIEPTPVGEPQTIEQPTTH